MCFSLALVVQGAKVTVVITLRPAQGKVLLNSH